MKQTIVIALVWLSSFGSIFAANGNFGGGNGTSSNPYLIEDVSDLIAVNQGLNEAYKLVNNIDLGDYVFTGSVIAKYYDSDSYDSFSGLFDGDGHTISNLTIDNLGEAHIGLFGSIKGDRYFNSIIKNLTLSNVNINGNTSGGRVAALVGSATRADITNCHVIGGNVDFDLGSYYNGSGALAGGLFADCHVQESSARNVTLSGAANCNVGGLVGFVEPVINYIEHDDSVRIERCNTVDCSILAGHNCGGLIGMAVGRYKDTIILVDPKHEVLVYDCYSTSSVEGVNCGGLIGNRNRGTLEDDHGIVYVRRCYSSGYVYGSGYVGGLIGYNMPYGSSHISDCFWNTLGSGQYSGCGVNQVAGITGLDYSEMSTQSNYTNWDFATVWEMKQDKDYRTRPMLRNLPEPTYYDVEITTDGFGSVSPSGRAMYEEGTELTLVADGGSNQVVDGWYVNGSLSQYGGSVYKTSPIYSDIDFHVTFKSVTSACVVHISPGSNGSVIPWPGNHSMTINQGEQLTLYAAPDNGYEVDYWTLGGTVYQYGSNEFTLYNTLTIYSDLYVGVVFKETTHSVLIRKGLPVGNGDLRIGVNGTVSPEGYHTALDQSSLNLNAVPDAGYEVAGWQVNGNLCGHGLTTYTIASVQNDLTINVFFRNNSYDKGTGTPGDPYEVYDAITLNAVNDELAAHYIMTNDIDLSGEPDYEDAVIGIDPAAPFLGVFDGNNKKITGLIIESHNDYLGLFGVVSSANGLQGQVKNLTLEGAILRSDALNVGVLCGLNQSGIIEKCRVVGVDVSGDQRVAGLCGYNSNGTIRYSSAEGSVTGNFRVGLLTGNCYLGTIHDCYAIGTMTIEANSGGGISGDSNQATISNCYASCSIVGTGQKLGSFCGWSQNSTYDDCLTNRETHDVAIGETDGSDVGTIAGPGQSQMQTMEYWTLTGWDFLGNADGTDDIWRMCQDGVDFPRLWWQFGVGDIACGDGVNLVDFATLSRNWLTDTYEPLFYDNADINGDGIIETADLILLAEHWLD